MEPVRLMLLFMASLCNAALADQKVSPAPQVSKEKRRAARVSSEFGYSVQHSRPPSTHFRQEVREAGGSVSGSYGFQGPSGSFRLVHYAADDRGFRAHVSSNEPGLGSQNPASVSIEHHSLLQDNRAGQRSAFGLGDRSQDPGSVNIEHHSLLEDAKAGQRSAFGSKDRSQDPVSVSTEHRSPLEDMSSGQKTPVSVLNSASDSNEDHSLLEDTKADQRDPVSAFRLGDRSQSPSTVIIEQHSSLEGTTSGQKAPEYTLGSKEKRHNLANESNENHSLLEDTNAGLRTSVPIFSLEDTRNNTASASIESNSLKDDAEVGQRNPIFSPISEDRRYNPDSVSSEHRSPLEDTRPGQRDSFSAVISENHSSLEDVKADLRTVTFDRISEDRRQNSPGASIDHHLQLGENSQIRQSTAFSILGSKVRRQEPQPDSVRFEYYSPLRTATRSGTKGLGTSALDVPTHRDLIEKQFYNRAPMLDPMEDYAKSRIAVSDDLLSNLAERLLSDQKYQRHANQLYQRRAQHSRPDLAEWLARKRSQQLSDEHYGRHSDQLYQQRAQHSRPDLAEWLARKSAQQLSDEHYGRHSDQLYSHRGPYSRFELGEGLTRREPDQNYRQNPDQGHKDSLSAALLAFIRSEQDQRRITSQRSGYISDTVLAALAGNKATGPTGEDSWDQGPSDLQRRRVRISLPDCGQSSSAILCNPSNSRDEVFGRQNMNTHADVDPFDYLKWLASRRTAEDLRRSLLNELKKESILDLLSGRYSPNNEPSINGHHPGHGIKQQDCVRASTGMDDVYKNSEIREKQTPESFASTLLQLLQSDHGLEKLKQLLTKPPNAQPDATINTPRLGLLGILILPSSTLENLRHNDESEPKIPGDEHLTSVKASVPGSRAPDQPVASEVDQYFHLQDAAQQSSDGHYRSLRPGSGPSGELGRKSSEFWILDDADATEEGDGIRGQSANSTAGDWRKTLEDEIRRDFLKQGGPPPGPVHVDTGEGHESLLYDSTGRPVKRENVPIHIHRLNLPPGPSSLPWKLSIPRPGPPRGVVIPPVPTGVA